jgi:hypothetical protein
MISFVEFSLSTEDIHKFTGPTANTAMKRLKKEGGQCYEIFLQPANTIQSSQYSIKSCLFPNYHPYIKRNSSGSLF